MTDVKIVDGSPPTGKGARIAAWLCYFTLGCGMLASWNALISAADYTEAMWPGRHVDRMLTVVYLPPCLVFLLLTMKLSAWTHIRMMISYAGFAVTLVIIPLMDLFVIGNSTSGPESVYGVLLAVGVVVGTLDGIGQGALYGDAALLPPEYTHALVGGTACAGTVICIIRVITKAAAPETTHGLRRSSDAYFFTAAAIAVACFVITGWVLPRLEVVKYWRARKIAESCGGIPLEPILEEPRDTEDPGPHKPAASAAASRAAPPLDPAASPFADERQQVAAQNAGRSFSPVGSAGGATSPPPLTSRSGSFARTLSRSSSLEHARQMVRQMSQPIAPPSEPPPTILGLWRLRWRMISGMALIYIITLSIFPGFLAEDVKNTALGSWYPVILFTVFNVGDMTGKLLPHFSLAPSQNTCLIASVSRVVFIPAFYCAARFGAPAAVMALLTLLLGLSNGFLTALIFARNPVGLRAIEAEGAAEFAVIGLVTGLNIGSYVGWLWLLGHH
ncbi:MAG: nucleoside transporter-domain-containing protein [Monoraphidium minutum]|nr:MAG: nucleoside transporter-domain-containing protein [Monoraphidium minutum]